MNSGSAGVQRVRTGDPSWPAPVRVVPCVYAGSMALCRFPKHFVNHRLEVRFLTISRAASGNVYSGIVRLTAIETSTITMREFIRMPGASPRVFNCADVSSKIRIASDRIPRERLSVR
jgi:hypothetical protein